MHTFQKQPTPPAGQCLPTPCHEATRAAGGKPEVIDLPAIGIKGNSHMVMMDKNNLEVAAVIQKWLAGQGLVR